MTVADIIEDAKYGELSNLGIAKLLDTPSSKEAAEKKVLSYINLGLIELYKRFNLRTEETVITMIEGQSLYTISTANVYHAIDNPTGYISELPGELNSILAAYDENGGVYTVNKESDPLSILTPSYNVVQIPNPVAGEGVYIIYNASPTRLVWVSDVSTLDVLIPPALLEAMLHYIGYRGHGAIDGNIQAENNTHYMRFDASCKRAITLGLITTDALVGSNVQDKGFV